MITQVEIAGLEAPKPNRGIWTLKLKEKEGNRHLDMFLSEKEAFVITKGTTKNNNFPDLLAFVEELTADVNMRFNRIVINNIVNGYYQACMEFSLENTNYEYDILATEAIAYAISQEADIFINEAFLQEEPKQENIQNDNVQQLSDIGLERALQEAIRTENYERASTLRDEIKRRKQ